MSSGSTRRVQQWLTFTRKWWLFDAKWQDPYESAKVLCKYLKGQHKPIYGGPDAAGRSDCGDHVVVVNSEDIALKGDEWYFRVYFHHTGYPGGASWTKAYELHQKDPTMIMWKAVYKELGRNLQKRPRIHRLHVYKDENVPDVIMENVSGQIRPLRDVPKKLEDYPKEDVQTFPKLWDYPKDHVLN